MGTDSSSHDVFARCIYGARVTLTVGVLSTLIGLLLGGLLGVASGYFQGWVDRIGSIITDSLLALPPLLLALLLVYRMDDLKDIYTWLDWLDRQWEITLTLGILASGATDPGVGRVPRAKARGCVGVVLADLERGAHVPFGGVGRQVERRPELHDRELADPGCSVAGEGDAVVAEGRFAFVVGGVDDAPVQHRLQAPDLDRDRGSGLVAHDLEEVGGGAGHGSTQAPATDSQAA
jgi:hypothetical protein